MTPLVCSRTKVIPLKKLTIPRLELITSRETHVSCSSKLKLKVDSIHLWTDSQVNLMDQILCISLEGLCQEQSGPNPTIVNKCQRNVPGSMKPADCASRSVSTDQRLIAHPLWWTGPQ
ncbi:uncharacterized protein LOC105423011 [Pogonomyrmex barbatus]|uniref:Uncharacterized protein LOC105423011 n=1 Tax=Pogonomyrmex barbatus TaxID=144034 RepID=A0A6I9VSX9_9HYME|nr:uncharacterized protein LOC105423011 [Pogonomyrmex barbatus]